MVGKAGECLFDPKLIDSEIDGLVKMLWDSIMKVSVSYRKDIYQNIVIRGGTTLLDGFGERLKDQMAKASPYQSYQVHVKVVCPVERGYYEFVGGSIVTSLSTFEQMWITKDEYDENGPTIVHRKCT